MHIVLNVESIIKPSGGIGRYSWHLLSGLVKRGMTRDLSCFANFGWINGPGLVEHELAGIWVGKPSALCRISQKVRSLPYAYEIYSGMKKLSFGLHTRRLKGSVYHEPNYILRPFPGPCISTVHDLSHLRFPQYHPSDRVKNLERNLEDTLDRAAHIITDSEFIKRELVGLLGVDEERVSAIHLGVDDTFRPRAPEQIEGVLSSYGLRPGRYLLSVSTLEPRKNVGAILSSYMRLDRSLRREYPLVLAGSFGWNNQDFKDRIDGMVEKGDVIYLGQVPEKNLPALFSGARGFVFIPFYEGFGIPPLEAMASGVPVLASEVASIPEVVGEAALLVDPVDLDMISSGMERLLTDEACREELIERGLRRAKGFCWDTCIEKTVKVYESVVN